MELPKTAVPIKGSKDHWIDIDGSVYALNRRNNQPATLIKKAQNTVYGYKYVGVYYPDKGRNIPKRVHKLVAEAFIPNPDNLPIVGHKNNIKSDNRVENLYWTTVKENTQKASDDGLMPQKIGFDNPLSKPVNMYDTLTNKLLGSYGSMSEAASTTGVLLATIRTQAMYKRPNRKPYYFRFADDPSTYEYKYVGQFDYDTDKLIAVFVNTGHASRVTGISDSTICSQIKKGKPKHKFQDTYFKLIESNKCEETIESPKGE